MAKKQRFNSTPRTTKQLRIIAGQWRGRKLAAIDSEGLRPTPDRVRETLFNWLSDAVPNATCLDLFAGSGALGIEALSRGAKQVDFVEQSPQVCQQLRQQLHLFNTNNSSIYTGQAQQWLNRFKCEHQASYDIVFIDPPFRMNLTQDCINTIHNKHLLSKQAWVYLEMGVDEPQPVLPAHWRIYREKNAGQVCYRLMIIK